MDIKLNGTDFDSYNIQIPVKALWGKDRENFLYKELDKRHPSFSNRYTYDEKLKLTWKGFVSEVTVIDKLVLGDYRTRFPSSRLKNEKGKIVFSGKTKIPFLLFLSASVIGILFPLYRLNKTRGGGKDMSKVSVVEEKFEVKAPEKVYVKGLYESLLPEISSEEGKVRSLLWTYDGYSEKLSLEIFGCYPTDLFAGNRIEELTCSSVVFEKGSPAFNLEKKRKVLWEKEETEVMALPSFSEGVRSFLSEFSSEEESERYSPFCVRFRTKSLEKILETGKAAKFTDFLETSGYVIPEIKISRNGDGTWTFEMTFIPGKGFPFTENILTVLSKNIRLFEKASEVAVQKKKVPVKVEKENTGKKVAVIKHAGNENIYFKNEKGRIIHEKKN